ncbi:hypothetical protein MVEN_00464600 [Mycena venus]|uniref:Cell wall protein n=1 Tax=Mycena venus TaxID=2733690 RepID=A0A8H6YW43_9AGAR|nr:hypothetical protein MVEN_00464600 [Mycena venus]
MARMLFALISAICVLQTLAVPHAPRATWPLDCSMSTFATDSAIFKALESFASINGSSDPNLLAAEGSLTAADNANTQIKNNFLALDAPPLPADALDGVVSGLKASLASLGKVQLASLDDTTKSALTSATNSINTALDAAQKSVAAKCQLTAFVAPSTTPTVNLYSMKSVSQRPAATTALKIRPSFASFAAPEASSPSSAIATAGVVAPENAAVVTGGNGGKDNGARPLASSMSLAGAISVMVILCFF